MSHAILSPSAASRWMACTPSARLEQEFKNTSSSYAEEGTLAHAVAELLLRELNGERTPKEFKKELAELQKNKYYTPAMLEYCQSYADTVWASCTGDFELFIEYRVDITNYVPEGFGTADAIVITNGEIHFFDLKYGKGVVVSATENPQLMLYGLGILNMFGFNYDVHTIHLNIVQPRVDNFSTYTISHKDLIIWAEFELKQKAILAHNGEGEFVAGKHCGFCLAKGQCKVLAEFNLDLERMEFKDPNLLSEEETIQILQKRDMFESWLEAVGGYVLQTALDGRKWSGSN